MLTIAKVLHEITPAWLEQVLREAGVLKGSSPSISSISTELIGAGNMGQVARVAISYTKESESVGPRSLAIKLAAENEQRRMYAIERGIYENEVHFYRDIASTVEIRVPRCYFAAMEPGTGWFNLVLEDLSEVAQSGNSTGGGTLQQARDVLSELIKLQTPHWNSPELATRMNVEAEKARTVAQFKTFMDSAEVPIQELGAALDAQQVSLIRNIMPRALDWLASWQPPFVIQHGDYRLDNMLFGTVAAAPPVTVVDWQLVRVGPPTVDLAFFLGECLPREVRRANERALLTEYHAGLQNAGVKGYTFDSLWEDYRRYSLLGLFLAVGTYRRLQHTEYSRKLFTNSIRKYADLALDLDAQATLSNAGKTANSDAEVEL